MWSVDRRGLIITIFNDQHKDLCRFYQQGKKSALLFVCADNSRMVSKRLMEIKKNCLACANVTNVHVYRNISKGTSSNVTPSGN